MEALERDVTQARARGGSEGDWLRYLFIAYRHVWLIVICLSLGIAAGVAYVTTRVPTFESSSVVRVEQPRALRVGETLTGTTPIGYMTIKTAARLVSTNRCAKKAVLLIEATNPSMDVKLNEILDASRVNTNLIEPDLVEIHVISTDAERSMLIANALAEAFITLLTADSHKELDATELYINNQVVEVGKELSEWEDQIAVYQSRTGLYEPLGAAQVMQDKLDEYSEQSALASLDLSRAQRRLTQLRAAMADENPIKRVTVPRENPVLVALKTQLVTLQIEETRLGARYKDGHPALQALKSQRDAISGKLNDHVQETVDTIQFFDNPTYIKLSADLVDMETHILNIETKKEGFEKLVDLTNERLKNMPEKQRKLSELMRQAGVRTTRYTDLLGRLQEIQIRKAGKRGVAVLADSAALPGNPMPVPKRAIVIFTVLLGLVMGCVLAVVIEALDTSVKSPEELEELTGMHSMGMVPYMPTITTERFLRVMQSRSSGAESVRGVRSNIKFLAVDSPLHTIMVTSALPGEGKSFMAGSLAIAFAQAGQSVVLIDADLRQSSIHRFFGSSTEVGLTTILTGESSLQESLQETALDNLQVIPAGPRPPNPAELLDSDVMLKTIDELKSQFEVIIIDSPPVLAVTDAVVLAPSIDGVFMVVEMGRTPRHAVTRAHEGLEAAQARIMGAVFNKLSTRSSYYYYSYYRYYHSYYTPKAEDKA